jgi:hypothetical protein
VHHLDEPQADAPGPRAPGRLETILAGTGSAPRSRAAPCAPVCTSGEPRPQAPRRCGAHTGHESGWESRRHAASGRSRR